MKLKRYENHPILSPKADSEWETRCVLNPAVVYDDEMQKFVMVYRSAGDDKRHEICMGLATSDDGKNFVRQSDKPVFAPNQYEPDGGCVEDPRIVKIGDAYFMTYAARTYAPGQYWLDLENLSPCYTVNDHRDKTCHGKAYSCKKNGRRNVSLRQYKLVARLYGGSRTAPQRTAKQGNENYRKGI